jgi:hypothetical protein
MKSPQHDGLLECLLDERDEVPDDHGFFNKGCYSKAASFSAEPGLAACHQKDQCGGVPIRDSFEKFKSVHPRHADIGDNDLIGLSGEECQGLFVVSASLNRKASENAKRVGGSSSTTSNRVDISLSEGVHSRG